MTPYDHSLLSASNFGGDPEDYLTIHEFLDSTKAHEPTWKHRSILHNGFGMILCEKIFGAYITNSDGVRISTREIARRHIIEDCNGIVPTVRDWLKALSSSTRPIWSMKVHEKSLEKLKEIHANKNY